MANEIVTTCQSSGNLNFKTAQKMIHRLLTEERIKTPLDDGIIKGNASPPVPEVRVKPYTKQELAKNLGVTSEEFEKLKSLDFYPKMVSKISLPLIRLYCATKFIIGK